MQPLMAIVVACSVAGCATIIKGSSANVSIQTDPPGAKIYVDDQYVGQSPVTVRLKQVDHRIAAVHDGYEKHVTELTTGFSGWSLMFFPFGTLVDAMTGAITTMDRTSLHIRLVSFADL